MTKRLLLIFIEDAFSAARRCNLFIDDFIFIDKFKFINLFSYFISASGFQQAKDLTQYVL